jgi:hypothetical protein
MPDSESYIDRYFSQLKKLRKESGLQESFDANWRKFLLGFLTMPWIWVWAYVFLSLVFLLIINYNQDNPTLQNITLQQSGARISIFNYWQFAFASCLANYTAAFLTRKTYPRLELLLFLISLLILGIFVFLLWPYFGFLFR